MRRPTFKMPLIGAAVQLLTKNHEPSWHQKYPSSESIMMMVVVDNKKKGGPSSDDKRLEALKDHEASSSS